MRRIVVENYVEVVGTIWMPACNAAQRIDLSKYDLENIGELTRENIDLWLSTHAGDFQRIKDFHASIDELEIPWQDEESECIFNDCMYGSEE